MSEFPFVGKLYELIANVLWAIIGDQDIWYTMSAELDLEELDNRSLDDWNVTSR